MKSLIQTKELLMRLVKDNPNCYLGVGADWKPLPGSVMTEEAVRSYGLKLPQNLKEWAAIDSFDAKKIRHPWYTKKMDNMIKLLQVAGQLMDGKIKDFKNSMGFIVGNVVYLLALIYKPLLSLRLRYNIHCFLIEYDIKRYFFRFLSGLFRRKNAKRR
jgi:hypothetical protein